MVNKRYVIDPIMKYDPWILPVSAVIKFENPPGI